MLGAPAQTGIFLREVLGGVGEIFRGERVAVLAELHEHVEALGVHAVLADAAAAKAPEWVGHHLAG